LSDEDDGESGHDAMLAAEPCRARLHALENAGGMHPAIDDRCAHLACSLIASRGRPNCASATLRAAGSPSTRTVFSRDAAPPTTETRLRAAPIASAIIVVSAALALP